MQSYGDHWHFGIFAEAQGIIKPWQFHEIVAYPCFIRDNVLRGSGYLVTGYM